MSEPAQHDLAFFVCPICRELIEQVKIERSALFDLQVEVPAGADPLEALMGAAADQQSSADEAVVLAHVQSAHTMAQVLEALGTARNALAEIREITQRWAEYPDLEETITRGLGGK